ncbi:PilW family protein [Dictyoglomus thermophilum]|uniref:Prokaryotic N-terminal methylation motif domain protein n=1 Tax=Dictyoglomus thermophilum (strain ATCC 35947 / DSM 3960 / H-6-12) TaxID=309799 RepID=B5YEF0_DICT6|nr:type II secretion system protein [Dictyoglomus thermophilum]ACI18325.1 prokaryotic N-terminal methylation motif domain protein [Dictyoglomus thermophilum H-6-12]
MGVTLIKKLKGFSLVELLVSMTILLIIMSFSLPVFISSGEKIKKTELSEMAKNIAFFTVEYIRSRNVNYQNNPGKGSIIDAKYGSTYGTSYTLGNDSYHYYPGLVDINGDPLVINVNPSLPYQTYNDKPQSFYSVLQGFVPFGASDANLDNGKDKTTNLIPLVKYSKNISKNLFKAKGTYIPKIYTNDVKKTNPNSPDYDPHYTNDASLMKSTMNYEGFRILTRIIARKRYTSDPEHVQFYDVLVRVFWVYGGKEYSYEVANQIMTWGD